MGDEQSYSSSSEYDHEDSVSSLTLQSTCMEARKPKPSGTKRRRKNEQYTQHQKDSLERAFMEKKLEDVEYQKKLGSELNLTEDRVKRWINNRKTKQNRERIENELQRLRSERESYLIELTRLSNIMSHCSSCNRHIRQRPPIQAPNVTEPSLVNKALGNHVLPANPLNQPMQSVPQGYFYENRQHDVDLLRSLTGVHNVCEAAYKEIRKLGAEAIGSLKHTLQMFHDPTSCGMTKELSIEIMNIPVAPQDLISIMVDVKNWAQMLSNIVYRASSVSPSVLQQLSSIAPEMKCIQMIKAELHLPTPIWQMRRCKFLRYWRAAAPNIWAIVDISDDYLFPTNCKPSLEARSRRNPSGLIITKLDDNCSNVIWIENMEVSSSITPNSAFCAKKWMVTLLQSLNRKSGFAPWNVELKIKGPQHLLNLADLMKMAYFERTNCSPSESEWVITNYQDITYNQDVRIMRKRTILDLDALGLTTLYAVASFVLVAEPCGLFNFLSSNLELQHLKMETTKVSEEIYQLPSKDNSSIIKLSKKGDDYFLKEVSMNEYCLYNISSPMSQSSIGFATPTMSWTGSPLIPSGFVILPWQENGLQSTFLVTIVASFDNLEASQANSCVTKIMKDIFAKITKEVQETQHQPGVGRTSCLRN